MNALVLAVGVIVFLIWRRQQSDALLGRPPVDGGADGSWNSQQAAAHGGSPVVGPSQRNMGWRDLESAIGAGAGAAGCVAAGQPALAPVCAKVGAYLAPKVVAVGKAITEPRFILGGGPAGGPAAEFKRRVLEQGKKDWDAGTKPLSKAALEYARETGQGKNGSGWLDQSQAVKAPIGPPKPAHSVAPTLGVWVSSSSGPAVESRTGRGRF